MITEQNNGSNPAENQDPQPSGNGVEGDPLGLDEAEAALDAFAKKYASLAPVAAKTLVGDMRDHVLDLVRELRDPWHKLSEKQQAHFALMTGDFARVLIERTVQLISAHDFPAIAVTLEQLAFKPKGIEAKLAMNAIDRATRHQLVDAQGKPVLIVIADPAAFMGARGPAKIDKQAPELPLDGEPNGEAVGPLPDLEARKIGKLDGLAGVRDHAARFPEGTSGHEDYETEWLIGQNERAALMSTARELGAVAGKAGADESTNPYAAGTSLHDLWLAGWIAPEPGNNGGPIDPAEAPKRRGRPRRGAQAAPAPAAQVANGADGQPPGGDDWPGDAVRSP